jgi:hypothetical protein
LSIRIVDYGGGVDRLAPSAAGPALAPARRFDRRRDLLVPSLAGAAIVVAIVAPDFLRGPAPVLLAVFTFLVAMAWAEELVRSWQVGDDWIAVRRWTGWRRLTVDEIRSVDLADADPFADTVVFSGARLRTVPVPLRSDRADPSFGAAVARLVEACDRRGAVPPEVAASVARAVLVADRPATGIRDAIDTHPVEPA